MDRRRAQAANGRAVGARCVSLVRGKVVARIPSVVTLHQPVAAGLRQYRRRGDGMALRIAPDHEFLVHVQARYLPAVDQDVIGRQAQSFDGPPHGLKPGTVDVESVDLRHLDPDHGVGQSAAPDLGGEASASELQAVRALREQFDQVNGRLLTVEERIHDAPQGEIFSTLEQLASQSQVSVDSMEPRSAPARDDYSETKVQVTLKGQTLSQVVRYLHGVESAPQPLSIKSLRIRTRADKPELLDVTFTVSSFEPIEG